MRFLFLLAFLFAAPADAAGPCLWAGNVTHCIKPLDSASAPPPAIGGSLTSGTSGSVLFSGNAVFAQDNAKLFWDDTNFRLGIGTTSPVGMLDVEGGTAAATTDGTALKIIAQAAGSGGNNDGGAVIIAPGAPVGTGKGGAIRASTTGNARGSYAVDLQSDRFGVQNVASGQFAAVLGGSGNEASGKASVAAGYQNTANADYSVAIAYQSLASGTQGVVIGGAGNVASGSNSAIIGGQNDAASASYSTALGGHANGAAHQYSLAGGGGSLTTENFDVVFGNSAGGSSVDNVHFRVAGDTSNVHVGRETDQSAVASAANELKFHTIFASHQSRAVGLKAPDNLPASYTLKLPTADGTNGKVLATNGSGQLSFITNGVPAGTPNTIGVFDIGGVLTSSSTLPRLSGSLSVDVDAGILYDNAGTPKKSLNAVLRYALDPNEALSIDWGNRRLIRSAGSTSISVDWENSTLDNASGTAVMGYAPAPTILSAGGSGGNIPYSCTTRTAATGTATSACSAGEIATGGGVNCGNTALFLSDSIPTGGPPSTGWAGSCTSLLNVVTNTTISVSVICCKY